MAGGWTPILWAGGIALALGIIGGLTTPIGPWYRNLRKPPFQPPDWAFGPAWTLILACAAAGAVIAWNSATDAAERGDVLLLFGVNAVFFLLWSPLFFVARRPDWALVEVVFLWASIAALVIGLWPIAPVASLLVLPYLLWVSFATLLNRAIVVRNAPFAR
ncbi:tryptophan-rich sensory protein [Sphingomonas baiyangensis]|uniref:Tryptophan-rich sensory protein n=2 Tax=Sphingomonas baiyangensis TaxID=2572576 RepID=A0A4U1L5H2_9SPHN|nr:tryptophan-rich sensory protein [Sphingomonas baiyangensis]